jgi:hypothetical protein
MTKMMTTIEQTNACCGVSSTGHGARHLILHMANSRKHGCVLPVCLRYSIVYCICMCANVGIHRRTERLRMSGTPPPSMHGSKTDDAQQSVATLYVFAKISRIIMAHRHTYRHIHTKQIHTSGKKGLAEKARAAIPGTAWQQSRIQACRGARARVRLHNVH